MKRFLTLFLILLPFKVESQFPAREYAARRAALASRMPDGVLIVLGAPEPQQDYMEFFQNPAMLYLAGVREPDAALVMIKRGGQTSAILFVLPRDPAQEVWTGARMGAEEAQRETGIPARTIASLAPTLDTLLGQSPSLLVVGDRDFKAGLDRDALAAGMSLLDVLEQRHGGLRPRAADMLVGALRGSKSANELALIRRAVDITVLAHKAAIPAVHPDMNEFEIEALIEYVFRRNGAERPSFASIVGSGPNSTTLHYGADDRFIRAGDVVVMDIGASYKGYAADVTRTVPASGSFSPEQREIYQLVRDAQAAAEGRAVPGRRAQAMDDTASAVLASGLARLGLIESAGATYDAFTPDGGTQPQPQFRMYYMHGLGHGIGLEVHDPEQFYFTGVLAPGSVFTIEPGIYVRGNLLDILPDTPRNRAMIARIRPAVQRFANVGVRIEDDYAITEKGLEWLSPAPREIAEIEALMHQAPMPPGRDAALVQSYRDSLP